MPNFTFEWYESYYTSDNLLEIVGGPVSDNLLYTDRISRQGSFLTSPNGVSGNEYYRKVFVRTDSSGDLSGARLFIEDPQYVISISSEKVSGDYSQNYATIPFGYTSGDFSSPTEYDSGIELGLLSANTDIGIWIKYSLSGDSFVNDTNILTHKLAIEGVYNG